MKKCLIALLVAIILATVGLYVPAAAGDLTTAAGDSLLVRREVQLTIKALQSDDKEAKYLQALEANPNFAPARYQLSKIYAAEELPKATEYARMAYAADSLNKWYTEQYAELALRSNDLATAERLYKKIIAAQPRNINGYRLLALIYESQQRPELAIALLDSAAVRVGSVSILEGMKQRIQVGSNREAEAMEEIQSRLKLAPADVDLHLLLSNLYLLTSRDSLAEGSIKRALEINPNSSQALIAAAEFYITKRRYDDYLTVLAPLFDSEAIPTETKLHLVDEFTSDDELYRQYFYKINPLISTLIIRTPNDEKVIECYAHHLIRSGMLDQALELYKSHIEDRPLNSTYISTVIEIESYKQRPDSVDLYIDRAVELFPTHINFRISKAISLAQAKEYEAAIESYKDALQHITDPAVISDIWASIGDMLHQINVTDITKLDKRELKESFKAYDRALGYNPDNIMVLNNYAYYLSELNMNLDKAAEMSLKSVEYEPSNATFLDTYGWILYKMGRYEDAKRYLQQAAALDRSQSAEVQLHYGDLLEQLGEDFMAEIYWRKAEKMGYPKEAIDERVERIKSKK